MANKKISDLTILTTPASGDLIEIVDVSDTTDSASGTNKRITQSDFSAGITGFAASGANSDITSLSGLTTPLSVAQGGTGAITASAARTALGVAIGTDVQAYDADLTSWSGKTAPTGAVVGTTDTQTLTNKTHSGDFNLLNATDNIQVNAVDPSRTITLNAGVLKPTTTAGCAGVAPVEAGTNDIDYDVLDFDSSTDENAFVNFQMPDSWDGGVIQFRYVWTNAAGLTTETVSYALSGRSLANDEAIDQAVGTAIAVSDTWLAQNDIHVSAWSSDVTLAGTPAGGEWVHLEIMRDVSSDNLTGDARLIAVQIRYKQGTYGD